MLIEVPVSNTDNDIENLLNTRFIYESDKNYPTDALHMCADNEPAIKRNDVLLNYLPGELCTIEADDKTSDNCNTHWLQFKVLRIKNEQRC